MPRLRFVSIGIALILLLSALPAVGPLPTPLTFSVAWGNNDEQAIHDLVEAMAAAVLAQDRETYLSYVDLSDPVFALEHTRWADGWSELAPVNIFELGVSDVQIEDNDATADLTMRWSVRRDPANQRATFPARFRRGGDGVWRYAGEAWVTVEVDHFRVHAFPGLEDAAEGLTVFLPDIYEHATRSLDHEPETIVEIKLYDSPESLVANTLLSLPTTILGWNEPGESLKTLADPDHTPSDYVLAHEFTHFLTFDMADTSHGNTPWWLMEGIAEYVGSYYWPPYTQAERLVIVQSWQEKDMLVDWDLISDFETTPLELWRYVYPQGYAFVTYVTDAFGEEARNDWLWDMAGEMNLDEATQAAFDMSFEELDRDFQEWLAAG